MLSKLRAQKLISFLVYSRVHTGITCTYYGSNGFISINDVYYYKGSKEMFYLTKYSTHFIYSYMASMIKHIVSDHSDCERKPAAATTWATLSNYQQGFFLYASSHRQNSTYHQPSLHQSWSIGWNEK